MRLKYISLCLLGLSFGGCTQHVIKSTTTHTLDQRAAHAVNAVFEYPSYDYNGTFKFDLDADQIAKDQKKKTQQQRLSDPELEKKVRAVLKSQRINLTHAQLEQLYQAIAVQGAREKSSSRAQKTQSFILELLNDMQFSYDGSVHYKQKLASMNLTAKYEKSTLLVQAKVPMVFDFKNYKFYTNYFALMPLMVNKENQSILAYVDFSKYKNEIERIDVHSLVTYLKESGALPYILADAKDIRIVSLSAQDKAQGAVEKIRLNTTLEEWMLQARLYERVNKPYLQDKMSAVFADRDQATDVKTATVKDMAEAVEAAEAALAGVEVTDTDKSVEAYRASQKLYELIEQNFELEQDGAETEDLAETEVASETEGTSTACDTAACLATDETVVEASDQASYISNAECRELIGQAKQPLMGDITYCDSEYGIDVLAKDSNTQTPQSDLPALAKTIFSQEKTPLDQQFEQYVSKDFKDAQTFKVLWDKQQAEVNKALSQQGKNPVVIDIALDDKGRAVRMEYDVGLKTASLGTLQFKTDMNIFNYGHAKPINRAELSRAKSIDEVSKGSVMENMMKGLGRSFGVDTLNQDKALLKPVQSLDQQLDALAIQVFDSTQSDLKTYQAVFVLKISAEQPEVVKQYSTAELNEIALAYAYHYAKEPILKGQDQAEFNRLADKHNLHVSTQYNRAVGESVYRKVVAAMNGYKERQEWPDMLKKHKTAKAVFTEYYVLKYLGDYEESEVDLAQKKVLRHTAQILAQAYEDTRKNKLTDKTIQSLTEDDLSYVDYELYQMTFEKVSRSFQ